MCGLEHKLLILLIYLTVLLNRVFSLNMLCSKSTLDELCLKKLCKRTSLNRERTYMFGYLCTEEKLLIFKIFFEISFRLVLWIKARTTFFQLSITLACRKIKPFSLPYQLTYYLHNN